MIGVVVIIATFLVPPDVEKMEHSYKISFLLNNFLPDLLCVLCINIMILCHFGFLHCPLFCVILNSVVTFLWFACQYAVHNNNMKSKCIRSMVDGTGDNEG